MTSREKEPTPRLLLHDRIVHGPLHLLRRNENGLTFALGYVLQTDPRFRDLLLRRLGIEPPPPHGGVEIRLQERDEEGITDLEIVCRSAGLFAVVEAKIAGWPSNEQLSSYAQRMKRSGARTKTLIALAAEPEPAEIGGFDFRHDGVRFIRLRWVDVLGLVRKAADRFGETTSRQEMALLIQEVLGMQSYDREVLVRDLDVQGDSLRLYLDHNVYTCQAIEKAEPLFFAPCFTNATSEILDGIHYLSRVYYREVAKLGDADGDDRALTAAEDVIRTKVEGIAHRKGASDDISYLKGLPDKWKQGLRFAHKTRELGPAALFFLGDPIRLPTPIRKIGKMVPIGFSTSLEHLMAAGPAVFKC